jgi:hypothetical protein
MKIKEIIQNAGMSVRPGYYSGRGATLANLHYNILEKIADDIQRTYGVEAMKSFVQMVWQMKVLSATAFLLNLFKLEKADWDLSKIELTDSDNYFESEGEAWGLLASVLGGGGRPGFDHTEEIRNGFRKP